MKVVVRGERNQNSNHANQDITNWALPLLFITVGALFFGIGLYVMISEEVFTSSDSEALFVSLMATILGGIGIAVGIYAFFKTPKTVNHFDLMQSGHCVKLPVERIENTPYELNGITGFYVVCRNVNDEIGCMDVYKSDVIYNRNCGFLKPGYLIPIYVDWNDPGRFYMDIDAYEKPDEPETSDM